MRKIAAVDPDYIMHIMKIFYRVVLRSEQSEPVHRWRYRDFVHCSRSNGGHLQNRVLCQPTRCPCQLAFGTAVRIVEICQWRTGSRPDNQQHQ